VPPWIAYPLIEVGQRLGRWESGATSPTRRSSCAPQASATRRRSDIMGRCGGAVIVTARIPDTWLYRSAPLLTTSCWDEGLSADRSLIDDVERLRDLQNESFRYLAGTCSPTATAGRLARTIRR
jgi:hypothetical protein